MTRSPTNAIQIFLRLADAARRGEQMVPRSASDKEYFAQDWFADRLREAEVQFKQQGRNSYPDFWVLDPAPKEGYEIKSLAFAKGRPARKDIDFNSTIPSGRKADRDVFLCFILYTGRGQDHRTVHTISLAHADLMNADHAVADEHVNVAIRNFGSFGDGFIRNRKMYVFPHPITIDPDGLGKYRLILPTSWRTQDPGLKKVGAVFRTVSDEAVQSYSIKLYGRGQAETQSEPYSNAGEQLQFEIFEAL